MVYQSLSLFYRMKCYQSSLRGVDLPNPQSILGTISKQTKTIVSKIGIFSVGSLQSVVSATTSIYVPASTIPANI